MASAVTSPPSGLAIVTSYPASVNACQGWISSEAQKPTGQPVVVDVVGLETTISTVFGAVEVVFTATGILGLLRMSAVEDRIDRVLADWELLRPDLDFSPVGVVARLRRVRGHFDRALEAVYAEYGLTGPDFEAIVILRRREPPYRASQAHLGRWLGLTPGTVSVRIDRLVEAGLVTRERDAADARSTLVRLSRRGQRLFDRVAPAHLDNQERLLGPLSRAECDTLAALLRKLLLEFEDPG